MEATVTRTLEESLNLIEETVNHYSVHPKKLRAIAKDGLSCLYLDEDTGNMCAVGRCLLDPSDTIEGESVDQFKMLDTLNPEVMKEQYRGYPFVLWDRLQSLHDHITNWSQSPLGLSNRGRREVEGIKEDITDWYDSNKSEE